MLILGEGEVYRPSNESPLGLYNKGKSSSASGGKGRKGEGEGRLDRLPKREVLTSCNLGRASPDPLRKHIKLDYFHAKDEGGGQTSKIVLMRVGQNLGIGS